MERKKSLRKNRCLGKTLPKNQARGGSFFQPANPSSRKILNGNFFSVFRSDLSSSSSSCPLLNDCSGGSRALQKQGSRVCDLGFVPYRNIPSWGKSPALYNTRLNLNCWLARFAARSYLLPLTTFDRLTFNLRGFIDRSCWLVQRPARLRPPLY